MSSVEAGERMHGDGYLDYVKPFRTVEDIHVFATATAYLLGLAKRTKAPSELRAELMHATRRRSTAFARRRPLDPGAHVALHGVSQSLARLFEHRERLRSSGKRLRRRKRVRWERDRQLLQVANTAREARFRKAVSQLGLC